MGRPESSWLTTSRASTGDRGAPRDSAVVHPTSWMKCGRSWLLCSDTSDKVAPDVGRPPAPGLPASEASPSNGQARRPAPPLNRQQDGNNIVATVPKPNWRGRNKGNE